MITVPEAARRVGKNPETIRRWIRAARLPAWKVGTQHVIDEDDLAQLVRGGLPPLVLRNAAAAEASTPDWAAAVRRSRNERSVRLSDAIAPYGPSPTTRPAAGSVENVWLPGIVGRIVRLVDPVRIVLFGSRARGTAREESDYDLLVVLDEVTDRRGTSIAIRRTLADLPISKDIVVATTAETDGSASKPRGVLHWALVEGRTVYERP